MRTRQMTTPLWPDNPSALDLLGFRDVTAPVAEALLRDKLDPVTVSIEGDWGSGKSSILALLATELAERDGVVVIQTHPWEYDPATDPKATLIAEVLTAIRNVVIEQQGGLDKVSESIRGHFRKLTRRIKVSKVVKLATNSVLSMGLPKLEELMELFGEDPEVVEEPTLQGFRDEFAALMLELPDIARVVVLVDDLDRCLPPTVVSSLEAVKLFLSVPKMAFVLAADRRMVALAIARQYEPSPQAAEMGRQYLEKIVQIPVRVPALGRGETEAYLALLMLERHLPEGATLEPYAAHCATRRAAGEADVLAQMPTGDLGGEALADLQLATMLAPILYERLEGNPRRLKRFLNDYWIRSTVAARRGIDLQPDALAKLMVLEQLEDHAFVTLLNWLREGELRNRLGALEQGQESVPGVAGDGALDALRRWAQLDPELSGVELDSYLRLAAALRSRTSPESGLPPEVRVLADLFLGSRGEQKDAAERLPGAALEHRIILARHFVSLLKRRPDQEKALAGPLGLLAEDRGVADAMAEGLAELDPQRIKGPLVVALTPEKDPQPPLTEVVTAWVASDRLDKRLLALARKRLGIEPGKT
ncbi:MAG: P-loop NTPase fold protein [Solirubrobacteraceae bacterium]